MKGLRKPKRRRPRASQGFWRKRFQGKARARKLAQIASRSLKFFVALVSTFQAIRSLKPNPPSSISSCVSAENRYWSPSETSKKVLISNHAFFVAPPNSSRFLLFSKPSSRTSKWPERFQATFPHKPLSKCKLKTPFFSRKKFSDKITHFAKS